jgi:sulfatase modifying factor 1
MDAERGLGQAHVPQWGQRPREHRGGNESGWDAGDWNNTTDIDPTAENLACYENYGTWTSTAGSQENLPINCVTWYEAYAFCIWDGGFLPSEAEWLYVAAGGSQQREFPWGSASPGTACPGTGCQYAIYNCDYPSGAGSGAGVSDIAPVGMATLGAGLWGQLDLSGDVFEWTLDWYYANYVDPCTNCANLMTANSRVTRGGGFTGSTMYLMPDFRDSDGLPSSRTDLFGFRGARAP